MTDTTTTPTNGNGNPLSPARAAIVEQGNRIHQEVAHERDLLRDEVMRLKSDIAGYKIALEAKDAQITEVESRMQSAYAVRDEAVFKAAKHETANAAALAVLRVAEVENAPLIKEIPDDDRPTIGGA
jgi:mannose-1-phosphate guanylyltransferase